MIRNEHVQRFKVLPLSITCSALVGLIVACSTVSEEEILENTTQELGTSAYNAQRGNKIADRAIALWNGHSSQNLCLKGVGDTLETSGVVSPDFPRLPAAVNFDDWLRANPSSVALRGFERQAHDIDHIPRGSIITWRPGQCGYHSTYGHVEIVSDYSSSRACSDYCGPIRKNCGLPGIFVPVGDFVDPCRVRADHKLHCSNRASPMTKNPWNGPTINTLRSHQSWFTCWASGGSHAGGNTTWYYTLGDDNSFWGFVPASALDTSADFDADPSAKGLAKCDL